LIPIRKKLPVIILEGIRNCAFNDVDKIRSPKKIKERIGVNFIQ
jgi:hypothetical protein